MVLTGSENQTDYVQVVRLGARGLLLKGEGPERLFAAIRSVASQGGFTRFRRAAETPFNLVYEARP